MSLEIKNFEIEIDKLKPTAKNPRQIDKKDFERLKKSLKDFPEMREIREIVVDEDLRVLGGHQRIKAMKDLGESRVYVKQVIGLSEEQKDEFVIKDNVQNGEWDMDILANEWEKDDLEDWGLDIDIPVASGLVNELKGAEYVDKENYFIKKPFLVIFYDEDSKSKLEGKLGKMIEGDTLDARDL